MNSDETPVEKKKVGRPRKKKQRGRRQGSIYLRGGTLSIAWLDHEGNRQVMSTGSKVREIAEQVLQKKLGEVTLRKLGVIDVKAEALADAAKRPLAKYLDDFENDMTTANRHPHHISTTVRYCRDVIAACGFVTAGDLAAEKVTAYTASLTRKPRDAPKAKKERGLSPRTIHGILTAIKSFSKFIAVKTGVNPLLGIKKPKPERQRRRRFLTREEWAWLSRSILENADDWHGVPAAERECLYLTAIQTGLRSNELRGLTRSSLFLSTSRPYILARETTTKNGKPAKQYVSADAARKLLALVATKAPAAPVFNMPSVGDVVKMFHADLADARRDWVKDARGNAQETQSRTQSDFLTAKSHEGEHLDFHALRHSCGAWLAFSGCHPKTIQTVMRHSSIDLTMNTYGHLYPDQIESAITSCFGDMGKVLIAEMIALDKNSGMARHG